MELGQFYNEQHRYDFQCQDYNVIELKRCTHLLLSTPQ